MEEPHRLVFAQQLCVVVAVTGAALVFAPNLLSTFLLPKMVVVSVAASAAVLFATARVWRCGHVQVRWNAATISALVLAAALCFATVTSPIPVMSLLGDDTRRMGLVSYLAYIALFLVTVHAFGRDGIERLVRLISLAALGVAGYGALQALGMDPFAWDIRSGVVSTLANANYVAAFLGAVAPLALWALLAVRDRFERVLHGASFVAALSVLPLTLSVQGAIVVAASLAVFTAGWLSLRGGRVCTVGLRVLAGISALGVTAAVVGLAGFGPLAVLGERRTFVLRTFHWRTAIDMWRDQPVTGVGLDLFHAFVRVYRPAELFEFQGSDRVSPSVFNVPLDMLVSGGVTLGLAYLAFIVMVGMFLVRGLMTSVGGQRLLLAALGGGWVGYQLQSLISIDVPPLAVLHYVLAGAIVTLSADAPGRTYALPAWAAGRWSRILAPVATGAAGVVILAFAALTVRADAAAGTAAQLEGRPQLVNAHADQAVRLAPWDPRYREVRAELLVALGKDEGAREEWRALLDLHPRWYTAHLGLARIAEAAGDDELAAAHYERALELEPLRPAVRREIALFELRRDRAEAAAGLMVTAVEVMPSDGESWLVLGRALGRVGDEEAARHALERATELGDDRTAGQARRYLMGIEDEGS